MDDEAKKNKTDQNTSSSSDSEDDEGSTQFSVDDESSEDNTAGDDYDSDMEDGYSFSAHETEVREIAALRKKDLQNPSQFSYEGDFTAEIAEEMIRTFRHFASKGIFWVCLYIETGFEGGDDARRRFFKVLQVANRASLFEDITIDMYDIGNEFCPSGHLQIHPSFEDSNRLKGVHLECFHFDSRSIQLLCRVLTQSKSLCTLGMTKCGNIDDPLLCEALVNSNISNLIIDCNDLGDVSIANTVQALMGHRTLKELLVLKCRHTAVLLDSVTTLLTSKSCRLTHFRIGNPLFPNKSDSVPIQSILQWIRKNKSLQSIAIHCPLSGDRPFLKLLGSVALHPKLQRVDVDHRDITMQDLQEARALPRFQRRFEIGRIGSNQTVGPYQAALKDFLDVHPEIVLRNVCYNAEPIKHANFLNHSGRYLVGRRIPLGLWPLVLARIENWVQNYLMGYLGLRYRSFISGYDKYGKNLRIYKADAIYHLLHGPAFAGSPIADDNSAPKSTKKRRIESNTKSPTTCSTSPFRKVRTK
ncbi:unnamed protein product [Cylindrotheca closterium]|uniref:Uncharacterized protein n=1 Tax=Cylindrotheca closterium TaxID=2856 RepID=A0AAD2CQV0_9STRA|nr:unnamed protein product [Cylindrotheca closterium]